MPPGENRSAGKNRFIPAPTGEACKRFRRAEGERSPNRRKIGPEQEIRNGSLRPPSGEGSRPQEKFRSSSGRPCRNRCGGKPSDHPRFPRRFPVPGEKRIPTPPPPAPQETCARSRLPQRQARASGPPATRPQSAGYVRVWLSGSSIGTPYPGGATSFRHAPSRVAGIPGSPVSPVEKKTLSFSPTSIPCACQAGHLFPVFARDAGMDAVLLYDCLDFRAAST